MVGCQPPPFHEGPGAFLGLGVFQWNIAEILECRRFKRMARAGYDGKIDEFELTGAGRGRLSRDYGSRSESRIQYRQLNKDLSLLLSRGRV